MTPLELDDIATELREGRPAPEEDFAAQLDEWAAKGFPSAARLEAESRLAARSRHDSPRARRLLPMFAGAATLIVVVVAVAAGLSQVGDSGDDDGGLVESLPGSALSSEDSGSSSADDDAILEAESFSAQSLEPASGGEVERGLSSRAAGGPESGGVLPLSGDRTAGVRADREKERTAEMTLAADPDDVPGVAGDVDEITRRHGGIVDEMDVKTDDQGNARANLALRVPEVSLATALSEIADLAHVKSRNEAARDVTREYVTAEERFADASAEVEALQRALAAASDPGEIESLRRRLATARRQLARARAQLRDVKQRANFSRVQVTVVSEDGGWSLGDAADDAVDVLEAIGGAALIGLAVLIPVGGLGALGWLATTRVRRRRREQVLDE